jgi:hypothetical protein
MEHAAAGAVAAYPWLVALEQSGVGAAMRRSALLYPLVETLHIIGFALLVGSIAAFDLRVLGLAGRASLVSIARITVPLATFGFFVAMPAGLLLFTTEATHIAANPAFQAKMACVAVGLANAALFRLRPWKRMEEWGGPAAGAPPAAKLGAAVSLLAWFGAICGGRLIAYV